VTTPSSPNHRDEEWWQNQLDRLSRFANHRIPKAARRNFDGDDVAASALRSYFRMDRNENDEECWGLLRTIAERKISKKLRAMNTEKRGAGTVRGESVFEGAPGTGLAAAPADDTSPSARMRHREDAEGLLALLPRESLRAVAKLRLEGLEDREIAERLGCGLRTVERRMGLIRRCWEEAFARDRSEFRA
jgi:DNA-directed RNA polymerase specialized sigma24 family protein